MVAKLGSKTRRNIEGDTWCIDRFKHKKTCRNDKFEFNASILPNFILFLIGKFLDMHTLFYLYQRKSFFKSESKEYLFFYHQNSY